MKDLLTYITEKRYNKKSFMSTFFNNLGYTVVDNSKMSAFVVQKGEGDSKKTFKISFKEEDGKCSIICLENTKYPGKDGFVGWEGRWISDACDEWHRAVVMMGIPDEVVNLKAGKKNYNITWTIEINDSQYFLWR